MGQQTTFKAPHTTKAYYAKQVAYYAERAKTFRERGQQHIAGQAINDMLYYEDKVTEYAQLANEYDQQEQVYWWAC